MVLWKKIFLGPLNTEGSQEIWNLPNLKLQMKKI